jgi:diketogulonate reductase-like aldo/keto reductase
MELVTLNNGVKMPVLGYGVYQVDPAEYERCVPDALEAGYRSIDTAQVYGNEEEVEETVKTCGVPREELFITTKIWISNGGYEKARTSIAESLKNLKTGYIDLLLIHQPFNGYYGAYRAMSEAYKDGKIRALSG